MKEENKGPTYNDSMNDWVARKNRLNRRFSSRLLTPHPDRPVGQRILGYLFRILCFLGILYGLFQFLLRGYLTGPDFSEDVSKAAQKYFKAETAEFSSFTWKGPDAVSKRFDAVGGSKSFFRSMNAEVVRADAPQKQVLKNEWTLERVQMETLDLALKSGMAAESASTNYSATDWMMAGLGYNFGIKPSFKDLTVNEVIVEKGNFHWGLSEVTRGGLAGASAKVQLNHEEGVLMEFDGGKLSQNWLHDLPLKSTTVLKKDGVLEINADIALAQEDGQDVKRFGTISGDIGIAVAPRVNLKIDVNRIPVRSLLPEELHPMLNGDVNLKADILGSTNTNVGVIFDGEMECISTKILALELFKTIHYVTSNPKFRQLATTGTLRVRSSERKLEVKNINLQSGDLVRIRGSFNYVLPELERDADLIELSAEPGVTPVPSAEEGDAEEDVGPDGPVLEGEIEVGISDAVVTAIPEGKENFFTESRGGFHWVKIDLSGHTVDTLTKPLADRIAKAFRDRSVDQ